MLLTLHNLPLNTRYSDVKSLIKEKCGLTEVILDNMSNEGNGKKVTVGLADEGDAAILVRKINGLYINGHQLYVVDVRQKKESEQPYRSSADFNQHNPRKNFVPVNNFEKQSFQPTNNYQIHNNLQTSNNYQALSDYQAPTNYQPFTDYQAPTNYQELTNNYQASNDYQAPTNYNQEDNKYLVPNDNYYQKSAVPQLVPSPKDVYRNLPVHYGHSDRTQNSFSGSIEQQQQMTSSSTAPIRRHGDQEQSFEFSQNNPSSAWDECRQSPARNKKSIDNRFPKTREPADDRRETPSRAKKFRSRSPPRDCHQHNPKSYLRFDAVDRNPKLFIKNENYSISQKATTKSRLNFNSQQSHSSNQSGFNAEDFLAGSLNSQRSEGYFYGNQVTNPNFNIKKEKKRPFEKYAYSNFNEPSNKIENPKPMNYQGEGNKFCTKKKSPKSVKRFDTKTKFDQKMRPKLSEESKCQKMKPARQNLQTIETSAPVPIVKAEKHDSSLEDIQTVLQRDCTWRSQAAAIFAKRMLKKFAKFAPGVREHVLYNRFKCSIKSRIDILLGERFGVPLKEILACYYKKFPARTDRKLFFSIMKSQYSWDEDDQKLDDLKPSGTVEQACLPNKPGKNVKKVAVLQAVVDGKLPKYPKGDKSICKDIKQLQRAEFENENIYHCRLPQELRKAVEVELTNLNESILKECENPEDKMEEIVCKIIVQNSLSDFKKAVSLNVIKRLLNIRTNLVIRIQFAYKPPKRKLLTEFLKQYGAVSLKKSARGKFLIATLDSYENYDKLCKLGISTIDNITVLFKPFHITGIPPKLTKPAMMSQQLNSENSKTNSNERTNVNQGVNVTSNEGENIITKNEEKVTNDNVVSNEDNQDVISDVHLSVSNSIPDMSNADLDVSNADPDLSNVDPDVSNADPDVLNVDPDVSNADASVSNADAGVSNADAGVSNADLYVSKINLDVSNIDPDMSNIDPDVSNSVQNDSNVTDDMSEINDFQADDIGDINEEDLEDY